MLLSQRTFGLRAFASRGVPHLPQKMPEETADLGDEKPRVLVVDDERLIRDLLANVLEAEGYDVESAEDGQRAIERLSCRSFDVVVSDLKMPNIGGLELLKYLSVHHPDTVTVIMTGFGTVQTAIDAMKHGAYDYLLKPFKVEEVLHLVGRGMDKRRLSAENLRLREALSLYRVSEEIAASLSLEQVLSTLAAGATSELRADQVSLFLDDGSGHLTLRHVVPEPCAAELLTSGTLDVERIEKHLREGHALLEHGVRALAYFRVAPARPVSSLTAVPLLVHGRMLGFAVITSLSANRRFDEGHRKLLALFASRAAVAIDNARLYQDLQSTFQQTIQGLAQAIDKLDRYTAGHSERVARYAVPLAEALGLSAPEVEILRQSALMHDIGKIGCGLNLNKPGRLSLEEYETFKRHPSFGRDILLPIEFLRPVIPGVYLHHERWDGRGYPLGIGGEQIPIMARIIAIADTYDAMTSDRAYRRAVCHEVTISEIEHCAGTQFDPRVAATFIEQIEVLRLKWQALGIAVPE